MSRLRDEQNLKDMLDYIDSSINKSASTNNFATESQKGQQLIAEQDQSDEENLIPSE